MLKLLVKKQIAEVFRSYYYDAKKNRMRSKWAIAGWIVFFVVVMVGMLGGMFTFLSLSLCGSLTEVGMGWLYFVLMGGIAIVLGAFGSVFNTYSGLYLSKDNDLLLSLPIPVRTVLASRLINVYLMGAMYSAVAFLPALIVFWIVSGATAARILGGAALFVIVTLLVLLLSCLLGWVVAKISLRLKNRSFITVFLSLAFIAAYYFVYFKANGLIRNIILHAAAYGARIRGAAYMVYLFGRVGEGDGMAAAIWLAITAAFSVLIWIVLSRSFLSIATASGKTAKARYVERTAKVRTPFRALLFKELGRFTASPNYMLNCGLGILFMPVLGVLLLFKGREICELIDGFLSGRPDSAAVLLCGALMLLTSMNDMAVPSVSLEGKSLWIPQSLPVEPRTVLRAKVSMQLLLTEIPLLFAAVCAALTVRTSPAVRLLLCLAPLTYAAFSALFGMLLGVRMPLLNWTNEIAPIKQSGAVTISVFGSWGFSVVMMGLFLLIGYRIGAALYLLAWTALYAVAGLLLLRWMNTRGAAAFEAL